MEERVHQKDLRKGLCNATVQIKENLTSCRNLPACTARAATNKLLPLGHSNPGMKSGTRGYHASLRPLVALVIHLLPSHALTRHGHERVRPNCGICKWPK